VIKVDSRSIVLPPDTTQGRLDEDLPEGTTEVAVVDDDEASVRKLESKLAYEKRWACTEGSETALGRIVIQNEKSSL